MEDTRSTLLVRLRDPADQDAWRTFDELYRPMLVGYACARGLGQADAEDVAQQCIQAVLNQIGDYQHLGSFRSWLRTIAERRICDLFRRRREVQADTAVWSSQPDSNPPPQDLWEHHWWRAHLRYCAERVKRHFEESTYAAFVGYAMEGEAAATVAEKLGLSVNKVYVAKHRVLERIRELMFELTGSELEHEPQ
ncbi:MAG: RNA polymerase sigma factor [Planctomycetota bacterium]|jgi:RNA polymerase sigma-70 factor (ECF subfamily)